MHCILHEPLATKSCNLLRQKRAGILWKYIHINSNIDVQNITVGTVVWDWDFTLVKREDGWMVDFNHLYTETLEQYEGWGTWNQERN